MPIAGRVPLASREGKKRSPGRRKLSTLDKLKIVVAQSRCPLCGEKLGDLENLDFDHAVALGIGGPDINENMRAAHRDCHKVKTSGKPATTLGSDIHAIAKTRRLTGAEEAFRQKLLAREPGQKRKPTGSIKSRGFPKTAKRRFG